MKRMICLLCCLLLLGGFLAVPASAFQVTYYNEEVYAGGILDMYAFVGEDDLSGYTFQWQFQGLGNNWVNLDDNEHYKGTKTNHLQVYTSISGDYTYWDEIPFQCRVEKDGMTQYTPAVFMHVRPHSMCLAYLEKNDFGLFEPHLKGVGSLNTSDYITYSATVPAGTTLSAVIGCKQPNSTSSSALYNSDVTFTPEVWITENGQTIYNDYQVDYMPYTIGENAVTIQYKLRFKLGINDMGYYETKTVHLTTTEPEAMGTGTVKQEIPLYREMYTQSRKLAYIPKGTEVPVVESIGGTWYKVCYGGFVGFVPAGCIEQQYEATEPVLTELSVEIEEPQIGKTPSFTAKVNTPGCELYHDEPVLWYDRAEDRFLSTNDVFEDGHGYQLMIYLSAQPGSRFQIDPYGNVQTKAKLNGNAAVLQKPYEMDPEKALELTWDYATLIKLHQCTLTYVPQVEPTCTTLGHVGYYHCECGANYADPKGKTGVNIDLWGQIPAANHTPGPWICDPQYHLQRCTDCNELIPGSLGGHVGGVATCQHGAVCTQCGMEYQGAVDHWWMAFYGYKEKAGHAHTCEEPLCTKHSQLEPHNPGPEATATEPQICLDCGYILAPANGTTHKHQLTKVEAKEATCTQSGRKAYYTCSGCSDWFADSAGKQPINSPSDVLLPALGHFTDDWQYNADSHWQSCRVCGAVIDFVRGFHEDADADGTCDVCGYQEAQIIVISDQEDPKAPASEGPAGKKSGTKGPGGKSHLVVLKGPAAPTEEPPQIPEGTQTQFVPAETTAPTAPVTPPQQPAESGKKNNGWLAAVLIASVSFSAAITATVILKKKKK